MRTGLAATIAALAIMVGASLLGLAELPADAHVAVRWSLSGAVSRFGTRTEALLAIPLAATVLAALLALAPRLGSREAGRAAALRYLPAWIAAMAILAALHAFTIGFALGEGFARSALVAVIAALIVGASALAASGRLAAGRRGPAS